jgi:hypothetical protein
MICCAMPGAIITGASRDYRFHEFGDTHLALA